MNKSKQLAKLITQINSPNELEHMLGALFTMDEIDEILKRVAIMQHLIEGDLAQRDIAKKLNVSIATITRGSNALKIAHPKVKKILSELPAC